MADPLTIAAVGTTVGGSILGAIGASKQGAAQSGMYQYQAGVSKINQQIAKQNADYERYTGEVEAQATGMKTRFNVGMAKAAQSTSGLDVNEGSTTRVRNSITAVGRHDTDTVRANAARRAFGYEAGAVKEEAQANIYGMAAKQSESAGKIGALSSLLSGAGSVSSKWLQAKQVGIFT